MKKQKLIEKINKIAIETPFPKSKIVDHLEVIKLIEQLDEPEKVTVPPFVAEKIEYFKKLVTGICFKQWIICLEKKKLGNGLRIKITKKHLLELGWTATRSRKRSGIWLRLKGILKKIRWFMEKFWKGISLQKALL